MCRADVTPAAEVLLAELLDRMATTLAEREGARRDEVLIGPVDFGGDHG